MWIYVFDGNPLECHYFMTLFHETVEKRTDHLGGKLTRLIKYTKGDAKEVIKHCVQQPPVQGFKNAISSAGKEVWQSI